MTGDRSRKPASDWFYVLISFLTLVTFAVAQTVYEILAANREFLTVRRVSNPQLLGIILAFNVMSPLILFLVWAACRAVHRSLARGFLAATYFALFAAFALQVHKSYFPNWHPFPHAYVIWIVPAGLFAFVSLQYEKHFRSFLLTLSVFVPIFPILFIGRTWVRPPVAQASAQTLQGTKLRSVHKQVPPFFLLVFDELSQKILLDDQGLIDGAQFPNFKKLADDGYWFRNTTANGDQTIDSIPNILTGNFHHGKYPSADAYPDNLFKLLYPYYDDIYIYEMDTHFCSPDLFHCPDEVSAAGQWEFLRDSFYLYCGRVIPEKLALPIPDMRKSWGPFRNYSEQARARVKRFEDFVQSLDSQTQRRSFYYFHHEITHSPYNLTSDGRTYMSTSWHFDKIYAKYPSVLNDLMRRYIMQSRFADKQLGSFVRRLKDLGIYDKSLIILTADHGVSWNFESPGRTLQKENAAMMLSVPLIIKPPLSKGGVVSDQDVQLIDIVPTVADLLGIQIPFNFRGESVFLSGKTERTKIAYDIKGARFEFPPDFGLLKVEKWYPEPQSPLIGQPIGSFTVEGSVHPAGWLDTISEREVQIEPGGDEFPISVSGWAILLEEQRIPEEIIISVNGSVAAVAVPRIERRDVAKFYGTPQHTKCGWVAQFSTRLLRDGDNFVTVYAALDPKSKVLAAIKTSNKNTIHRTSR
jgi:hypothetical protein